MNHTEATFQIILHGGNARSLAMEAIALAKDKDMPGAREVLRRAGEELAKAHQHQTALIQAEVVGEDVGLSMLLVHAQDHLMNAMTTRELANEFVELYERIHESEEAGA